MTDDVKGPKTAEELLALPVLERSLAIATFHEEDDIVTCQDENDMGWGSCKKDGIWYRVAR